jgi:two-component system sensor histidine kinase FlrB
MASIAALESEQTHAGLVFGKQNKLNKDELRDAFHMFNQMSQQLSESYEFLESKVEELSGELATVSEQRMRELAEKERIADRLESLLTMLPGGVVLLDGAGRVRECNPAAHSLLAPGSESDSLINRLWRDVITTSFSPQADDGHEISLTDGRKVSLQTASLGTEPGQIILITDQTETRQLQARLSQHQRLSSMGNMVASLAHQIRTPLSAAMIYGEHLKNPQLDESQRERFSEKLLQRLQHLEHQVRDMLIFARGDAPLNDEMLLKDIIKEWQTAIEVPLEQHAGICEFTVDRDDVRLHCNKDALVGALMNLVNNSLEAVAASGVKPHLQVFVELDQKYQVSIAIQDNGPGFEHSQDKKILEPFYTTKSNGTGLGLAVVQAIARAHYGEFRIESNEQGALAILTLPAQPDSQQVVQ